MNRLTSARSLLTGTLISLACLVALVIATGYVLMRQNAATKRLNRAIDLHDRSCRLLEEINEVVQMDLPCSLTF